MVSKLSIEKSQQNELSNRKFIKKEKIRFFMLVLFFLIMVAHIFFGLTIVELIGYFCVCDFCISKIMVNIVLFFILSQNMQSELTKDIFSDLSGSVSSRVSVWLFDFGFGIISFHSKSEE